MKNTVIAIAIAGLVGVAGSLAMAQDQQAAPQQQTERGHGRRQFDPERRVNMLAKRLNLTDDQKQKLQGIFADQQQQMQSMRQDSSLSRQDRMEKMKTLRSEADEKVNGILNDDQKQKYAQMKEKARERMEQHRGGGDNQSPNNNQ
jgi:Spy/CpxP family protein refolding chaperone